jgi:hypothetical protein
MGNYRKGNGGPAKGHVREAFLEATLAYMDWEDGDPEPTVDFEGRRDGLGLSRAYEVMRLAGGRTMRRHDRPRRVPGAIALHSARPVSGRLAS